MPERNPYDRMARSYAELNETQPFNALYERPNVLAMLGDVSGLHVLDAGCGPGAHAAELRQRGAQVEGCDRSQAMLAIARQRLGAAASFQVADLTQQLPYPDGRFDAVLASLVLHYLRDWEPALREFRRVLVPGGRVVVSTHHPFEDYRQSGFGNYFATAEWDDEWTVDDETFPMRFWRRPLTAMWESFTTAGFTVETVREPRPLDEARERFPDAYRRLTTAPAFLFFALRAR
ncbi:MAG: methyltransferase domain-containing protein [Candidatus Dormiibacterota bacterium]